MKGRVVVLIAAILTGLTAGAVAADQIRAPAGFSRNKAETGDMVSYCVDADLPPGSSMDQPPPLSGVDQDNLVAARVTEDGRICLDLIVDTLDRFAVGPVEIGFTDADGRMQTIVAQPAALSVTTSLPADPDKQPLRPYKGPVDIPGFPWVWVVVAALVLAAVGVGAYFLFRRRRQAIEAAVRVPPHERARQALDRLEVQGPNLSDKEFYFELSRLVRTYMEDLRGFPAVEMTYEEIRRQADDPEDRAVLGVLADADLVKFAKGRALSTDRDRHLAAARDYVDRTTPKPEENGQEQGEP